MLGAEDILVDEVLEALAIVGRRQAGGVRSEDLHEVVLEGFLCGVLGQHIDNAEEKELVAADALVCSRVGLSLIPALMHTHEKTVLYDILGG